MAMPGYSEKTDCLLLVPGEVVASLNVVLKGAGHGEDALTRFCANAWAIVEHEGDGRRRYSGSLGDVFNSNAHLLWLFLSIMCLCALASLLTVITLEPGVNKIF